MSILGSLLGDGSNRPELSQTMQSNAGGLMSKFNPFNLVSGMFGRRKAGAADNYAKTPSGMRKGLKESKKKDPKFASKTPRGEVPAQKGDSVTDIAAKLYGLIRKNEEKRKKELQIEQNFAKSLNDVKEKRNQQLIAALTAKPKDLKKETKQIKKESNKVEKETKEAKKESGPSKPDIQPTPTTAVPKQLPAAPKGPPPSAAAKPPTATPAPPTTPAPSAAPFAAAPTVSTATQVAVGGALAIGSTAAFAAGPLAENIVAHESKVSSPMRGMKTKWKNNSEYNAYNKGTIRKGGRDVTLPASFDQNGESVVDFSKMTIAEYLERGKLKSGDPNKIFAMGRYQIIPNTMEGLVKALKLDPKTTYLNKDTQDYLFMAGLIGTKRKKVKAYIEGDPKVSRNEAILELAMEFASIGVPYDIKVKGKEIKKGQSYYSQNTKSGMALNPPEEVGKALDAEREKQKSVKEKSPSPNIPKQGETLNKSSMENKDLKKQTAAGAPSIDVNIKNNVIAANQQRQTMVQSKSDASRFTEGART